MADTVFGKIVRGEIPCNKVYEDDKVLAFLDISPLAEGHTLVVPKEPAETLDRLSDESAAAVGRVLPRLCRAVVAATGVKEYNVLENNGAGAHQAIEHVHFHIIPKPNAREGLGIGWPARGVDREAAAVLAKKIAAALS
jgi:histidine triad (HIT) family protein